ncbi:PKD domain-containing protein [Cerasicoccus maritimus]|uniref:PKD domain-containing protein n=1 Tax=Cerasicoccus maritimus TaxID=490089 RepID=UPI0028525DBF|nr:PKD domain-containing protein [Cerasicoccus maritimus]
MRKSPLFIAAAIALLLFYAITTRQPKPQASPVESVVNEAPDLAEATPHTHLTKAAPPHAASVTSFEGWLATEPLSVTDNTLAVAQERRERMRWLMQNDPEQALVESVSWAEYQKLPDAIRPYVEQPFSEVATLRALPVCDLDHDHATHHEGPHVAFVLEIGRESFQAGVYGRRLELDTKEGLSLQGIVLDDLAAIRETVLQPLDSEDTKALAGLPLLNPDTQRGFYTGQPLGADTVVALAGRRKAAFVNEQALAEFNDKLAQLDQYPGPYSHAELAFALPYAADGDGSFDFSSLEQIVIEQASTWTETEKRVFFIRIDFSDLPGESISQALLQERLTNDVSPSIYDMSLGKTFITADVSSMVVRMPNPTTTYLPLDNTPLYNDAIDAFNALGTGINLGEYDIIGVHFASIGISSGGQVYAGLAGGSRQWLQGTSSAKTIVHEFGHNYGLAHANFWYTTDGTVLGDGSSIEYGDNSDIMGSGSYPYGFFHGQARDKLNWFEDGVHWTDATINGAGDYRIYQLDDAETSQPVRSVRITRDGGTGEYFWIGYRANLDREYYDNGAYLVWQQAGTTSGLLMDANPGTGDSASTDRTDAPLLVGKTFSDATSDTHITPIALGGTSPDAWIDVHIEFGPFPGNSSPTASINGATTLAARTSETYTASTSDANGDTLAYFWDTGDDALHGNVNSVEQIFNVGGSYDIEVTVSDRKGGVTTVMKSVTVTDPLDNWVPGTITAERDIDDIDFLNGRFIAAGDDYIYTSFDGVTWSEQYISINFNDGGTAYGNGVYVIAGYDYRNGAFRGVLYTSPNGFNWTDRTTEETEEFRDIAFGSGRFVAIGNAGLVQYSEDGTSWTNVIFTSDDLKQIAFGDGAFIAVSDNGVWRSEDGVSWTNYWSATGLDSWRSVRDVFFHDGKFYIGGWYAGIHYSTDGGITWAEAKLPEGSFTSSDFAAHEGTVMALAYDQSTSTSVNLVSADGATWSVSSAAPGGGDSVTFGNGYFITVYGEDGAKDQSDNVITGNTAPTASIVGPSAGNAREYLTFTATVNDADGDELIYHWELGDGSRIDGSSVTHRYASGGQYDITLTVTDSQGGVTTDTQQLTITDPINNWTLRNSASGESLYDICFGNGRLVTAGKNNNTAYGIYRYSDDGSTWNGGNFGINVKIEAVIWDGSQFVAVGEDYDFDISQFVGVIYTSPDGVSWTRRYKQGGLLNDVATNGSLLIAVGTSGTIVKSSDGVTWLDDSLAISNTLDGIDYSGSTFVIAGNINGASPIILTSIDGSNWADTTSGFSSLQGPYKLQFCHDRFLSSGYYTRLRHSTDEGVTFSSNRVNYERIEGFAHGNDVFLATGVDQSNSNAPISLTSLDGENWSEITTPAVSYINAAVFYNNTFVMVGSNGEIWQTDAFSGLSNDPWIDWQLTYFPSVVEKALPHADSENDGLPNLYEYYAGGNPLKPDTGLAPLMSWNDGFVLTLPHNVSATDVDLAIFKSTNLVDWFPASYTDVSVTQGEVILDVSDMPSGGDPLFLQIEFTQN